jgi:hypothetical protein
MSHSKEYMLLFRFNPAMDNQPTEAQLNEQHQQWGSFIGGIAIQEKLVSTHQLGFSGAQVFANNHVADGICVAENKTLGGNMVIRAGSLHEAISISKNCPILFMGGSVEVREIQPM